MNNIQMMAIEASIKHMMAKGYISICTINKILEITGGVPSKEDMQVLELIHCVDFRELHPEFLRGLPIILQRVFESTPITFRFQESTNRLMLVR